MSRIHELRAKYRNGKDLSETTWSCPNPFTWTPEPPPPPKEFKTGDEVFVRCLVVSEDSPHVLTLQQIDSTGQLIGELITTPQQEVYEYADFAARAE